MGNLISVYIYDEDGVDLDGMGVDWGIPVREIADTIADAVVEAEIGRSGIFQGRIPYKLDVDVVLTDDAGICDANRQFRGIDAATDVLSFPLVDFEPPADFGIVDGHESSYVNPDDGTLCLGDIMISMERCREQAAEYGHSMEREFAFLITHSMLHLLGYDHMDDGERLEMEEKQEAILQSKGFLR
ncbi:MAG: rRNA maturation RNase YbeY [Lachnospiraceae bacterium]|jgi:probable rRNA maturation factor|nr:rRNA maturation RNase YbeY [Lachnospiraceae bacterium]